MITRYVLFRVEGRLDHVDARVRDLLRQWESHHVGDFSGGKLSMGREPLLNCAAEVVDQSVAPIYEAALKARSATTHELIHQEKELPYAPQEP